MGDDQAQQGAHDGIAHPPGAIGQQGKTERPAQQRKARIVPQRLPLTLAFEVARPVADRNENGQQRWDAQDKQHQRRPPQRHGGRQQPAVHQRGKRRQRHQRAPQIVSQLPAAQRRDGCDAPLRRRQTQVRQEPGQKLPVAARPAVLARGHHVVAVRGWFDHGYIAHYRRACKQALEQVVTQNRILADTSGEGVLERIDVVQALACEGSLREEVLIEIGDGKGIGVQARRAGEDALHHGGALCAWQRRRHPRLQDAVAGVTRRVTASKCG